MSEKNRYATKQEGSTKVDPFWSYSDIKGMMDWFINHKQYDNYLIFMFGLLMGRRIGDTLSVKWSDIYQPNGRIRTELNIKEQKTGKTSEVFISPMMEETIDFYLSKTGKKPMEDYEGFVFEYAPKTAWIKRKNDSFYSANRDCNDVSTIEKWRDYLGKDIDAKRIESIMAAYEKQKISKNKNKKKYVELVDYLYYYVEFMDVIKSQQDSYRKQLTLAAKEIGLKYPVSTHSTRKTFGMITKKIHPDDIYAMETLQDIFEHSTIEQTRDYIGISKQKKQEFFNDIGDVIRRVSNGETEIMVNNSPIVSFKHDDLRQIIMFAIQNQGTEIETFNQAMSMVDELKIKSI